MAGSESQQQLLTLIRQYSTEKSQGERRIVNGKKQIEGLMSKLEAANAELEEDKSEKEKGEQELKGYEVELSMNEASIQALGARISFTNNEVSKLGSESVILKSEENSLRDGFIVKMLELNAQIRKFLELLAYHSNGENHSEATLRDDKQNAKQMRLALEKKLAKLILCTNQEEQKYESEKVIHDQLQQELINLEKRVVLLESLMKENMEVQELSRQTQELEKECAAIGDELQKKFICPTCHQDNSRELVTILQISNEN